jgi:50S ribosomal subunit-associated GTPase HflX
MNKSDTLSGDQLEEMRVKFAHLDPIFLSAHSGAGVDELKNILLNRLK